MPKVSNPCTIVYTVDCQRPETHVYEVTLDLAGFGPGEHDLALPVWTPGAYEVQDFSRHVFDVKAFSPDGHPIRIDKTQKNVWRFQSVTDGVTVQYSVYAFQLAVDTSHLDDTHAYWNGASLFFAVDDRKDLPVDVHIKAPPGWYVSTGLDGDPEDPFHFRASDYDTLIDCPVEVGTHRRYSFEVDGKPHTVAIWGSGNQDDSRLVEDTRRIVEVQARMFGGLPYRHYVFIFHIADQGGGLEHLNSTTCAMPRHRFKPWKSYRRVLGLISHEFFHLWNVKRIHPDMLGPFNYNQEVYTHLLWAMEGFTDYYAYLLLRRSGLYQVSDYLDVLSEQIKTYEKLPGRLVMDLAHASFDSWIKLYKPDEDSPNRSISYYLKGGLVGVLLDLEIRRRTQHHQSLDDVLRLLYERYGRHGVGFPEPAYQQAVEEVAGGPLTDFFARYIHGVDPIPLDSSLAWAGLEIQRLTKNPDLDNNDAAGDDDDTRHQSDPPIAWLGIETRTDNGKILASVVYDPGPSATHLYPGDELVALEGYRITDAKQLHNRLRADWRPKDTVSIAFFRRGRLETRHITLGEAPPNRYRIVRVESPTPEQQTLYEQWLGEAWPAHAE